MPRVRFNSSAKASDDDHTRAQSAAEEAHHRAEEWHQGTATSNVEMLEVRRRSIDSDIDTINSGENRLLASGNHDDSEKGVVESKSQMQAKDLVRAHTRRRTPVSANMDAAAAYISNTPSPGDSGYNTPTTDTTKDPANRHGGVLTHLLKLYSMPEPQGGHNRSYSGDTTPIPSGLSTPRRKWYDQKNQSQETLAALIGASAALSLDQNVTTPLDNEDTCSKEKDENAKLTPRRPKHRRIPSSNRFSALLSKNAQEQARIANSVADILKRQRYLLTMCRALMLFGAPTHRLEEFLNMAAKELGIRSQFLYLPGCMIVSFDDDLTHTTEVKIVRTPQGVNLGKLKDVHEIYKEVLHDVTSLDEAMARLEKTIKSKDRIHVWFRVGLYGVASAMVCPFGFSGRYIDMPIAFILGCLVGFLQLIVAPLSDLYSNVFEVVAAVLTSFLARLFGSIRGGELFCFSALAQSSIALILPGYLVLCSALELQSKTIVPGSIRMVYSIIYSLFLGFGITVGTAVYGAIDSNAVSSTQCENVPNENMKFIFVPLFALCLAIINQAKWKQMPMMVSIAMVGYVTNFFSSKKFDAAPQIANTLGALAIGVLANLYSRLRHGVAAAAMLPAIFVQVPSGLAATGSLLSGINTANQLTGANETTTTTTTSSSDAMNAMVFNVAASMIQIAVGITVGLFLAAIFVYPFGKRRSGLFSF